MASREGVSESERQGTGNTPEGTVLVVGGAGYIGSHTVRLMQERNVPVVVFDNLSTGHRAAVDVPLVIGDLADRAALASAFREHRPTAVIHFAALCYVGESVVDPARYYRENLVHTYHLLEEMRVAGCRDIVFSSTCAVYGIPPSLPITEDMPRAPINPYGRTKLAMEGMMEDFARAYEMRCAALRYFNAAGAMSDGSIGEHHDPETHLIPLALDAAAGRGRPISVFGTDYPTPDGTCIRDYIHVVDLADAHLRALHQLQAGRRQLTCNLGTGRGHSVREVIEMACRVVGRHVEPELAPRRPGDPPELVSGGSLAADLLGWEATSSSLEGIVRDAWAFREKHPEGYGAG